MLFQFMPKKKFVIFVCVENSKVTTIKKAFSYSNHLLAGIARNVFADYNIFLHYKPFKNICN